MLVELGNHAPASNGEAIPGAGNAVTQIEIPEPDAGGVGGYSFQAGITPAEFQRELIEAEEYRGGIYRLPDHEVLLAVRNAWRGHSGMRPAWLQVTAHPQLGHDQMATDVEAFLHEHYGTQGARKPANAEDHYWTRWGAPGDGPPLGPPPIRAVYTNDGRIMNNFNDGGDSLTAIGQMVGTATGSSATGLSGCTGLTSSGLVGHRIYVYSTSSGMCYGNVTANTTTTITVDQWYVPATPGGSVASSPSTPFSYVVVDGGLVSTWFSALAYGANSPGASDHTLATNGNTEYSNSGSTLSRKLCPTATTNNTSARTVTLVPVFTVASSDVASMPKTMTVAGFFASAVAGFGGAGGPMKFETALSSSATVANLSDQITLSELITGS